MTMKLISTLKIAAIYILVASLIFFLDRTIHWPVTGDAALMHYVASAMHTGKHPYTDIAEINLPLAYAPDWIFTKLFHSIDLPWRLYDLAMLGLIGSGMWWFAPRNNRFAAFWPASVFAAIHARDGIEQAGQRDLLGTVLLLFAVVCLVKAYRVFSWRWAVAFGALVGSAALIKPTLGCFLLLGLLAIRRKRSVSLILASVAGFSLPVIACVVWLGSIGSLHAFFFCLSVLAAFHATLGRAPLTGLLYRSVSPLLPLVGLWGATEVVTAWKTSKASMALSVPPFEQRALGVAALIGLLSFVIQGKSFPYQRYPFLAMLLLLIAIRLMTALDSFDLSKIAVAIAIVWTSFVLVPSSVWKASRYEWQHRQFVDALHDDLAGISRGPVTSLSGDVLCLDSVSGCFETLYRLKLLSASRIMYDEFLFHANESKAVQNSRAQLWIDVQHPPRVIVVSADLFPSGPPNYDKLNQWPEFKTWLDDHYGIEAEHTPAHPVQSVGKPFLPSGFRMYVLRREDRERPPHLP